MNWTKHSDATPNPTLLPTEHTSSRATPPTYPPTGPSSGAWPERATRPWIASRPICAAHLERPVDRPAASRSLKRRDRRQQCREPYKRRERSRSACIGKNSLHCCSQAMREQASIWSASPRRPDRTTWESLPKVDAAPPTVVEIVRPGRDLRARSGACSVYERDSAGPLADRLESDDRQAPRGRTVGACVVAAFMPKRNSLWSAHPWTVERSAASRDCRIRGRTGSAGSEPCICAVAGHG